MFENLFGMRDITFLSVIIRLAVAFFCGGVIGIERSYKNRAAGFRTHMLVAVAAAAASMTGLYLYLNAGLPSDISRIGAQVVSGLGFIGAGTIILTKKPKVTGLTTAAGLWASGIIGLAIGDGFYEGAIIATVLVLLVQIFFSMLEEKIKFSTEIQLLLKYSQKEALDSVMRLCKDKHMKIANLQVVKNNGEKDHFEAIITVLVKGKFDKPKLIGSIDEITGVVSAEEI